MGENLDDWLIEGRWYQATIASDPTGLAAELDDIAPAPGRGMVLDVHRNDDTGEWTFGSYAEGRLPLAVVERFIAEARGWLTREELSAGYDREVPRFLVQADDDRYSS